MLWIDDICWAVRMLRARRYRRQASNSGRLKFDVALVSGTECNYPDAIYHTLAADFRHARYAASRPHYDD